MQLRSGVLAAAIAVWPAGHGAAGRGRDHRQPVGRRRRSAWPRHRRSRPRSRRASPSRADAAGRGALRARRRRVRRREARHSCKRFSGLGDATPETGRRRARGDPRLLGPRPDRAGGRPRLPRAALRLRLLHLGRDHGVGDDDCPTPPGRPTRAAWSTGRISRVNVNDGRGGRARRGLLPAVPEPQRRRARVRAGRRALRERGRRRELQLRRRAPDARAARATRAATRRGRAARSAARTCARAAIPLGLDGSILRLNPDAAARRQRPGAHGGA